MRLCGEAKHELDHQSFAHWAADIERSPRKQGAQRLYLLYLRISVEGGTPSGGEAQVHLLLSCIPAQTLPDSPPSIQGWPSSQCMLLLPLWSASSQSKRRLWSPSIRRRRPTAATAREAAHQCTAGDQWSDGCLCQRAM